MFEFELTPILEYAEKENIELCENACEKFKIYGELLIEWNERINLTAITDPK